MLTVSQDEVEQLKQKVPISKKLRKQPDLIVSEPIGSSNDIVEEISTTSTSIQHLNSAIIDLSVKVNNHSTVVEDLLSSGNDMANEILILKEEIKMLKYEKQQQLGAPECSSKANNSGSNSAEHTSQTNMSIEHFNTTVRNLEAENNNLKQVVEELLRTQENMMDEMLILKKEISLLKENITL